MSRAHTPGPWAWTDRYTLRPANPRPSALDPRNGHDVHTILQLETYAIGFCGSDFRDPLAEDEANRELLKAAPVLYDAIDFALRTAKLDRVTEKVLRQALASAQVDVPEGVAV